MPDDPAPAAPRPLAFHRIPLSILVLASTGWQALRLSADFGRHITSGAAWITLAAALPFLVMSVVGAIALLRGDRPRSHWIWVAAVLSLFRWPVPDLPTLFGFHIAFPVQRLLNVVVAVLALVACRFLPRCSDPEPGRILLRTRAVAVVAGILVILVGRFMVTLYSDHVAAAIVNQGNDAFEAGRADEAIALWERVRAEYPHTRAEGMALFNTSYAYRKQGRWAEAIPLLETLLAGDLNDTDPTRELMNPYQNYHHRACLGLVDCHEHLEDHRSALRYATLARDVYPYRSWCGTCLMDARQSLHRKIARLEAKVAGRQGSTTAASIRYAAGDEGKALCLAFGPDGSTLLVGTSGGVIKTWGILSGEVRVGFLQDAADEIDVLALAPDRNTIAAWGDGKVSIQRLGDERTPTVVMSGAGKGHSLAFSPDGRTLASGGDGWLVLWDTDSGRETARIENQGGWIDSLAFTADGGRLAFGVRLDSRDRPIKLWDVKGDQEPVVLHRDSSAIYSLAFSPDGKVLACGNQRGGPVELWDVDAASQLDPLHGHKHNAIAVGFCPDGKTLVSGDVHGVIRVWDLASRETVQCLKPDGMVGFLAITADGKALASLCDWGRTPELWDVTSGKPLLKLSSGKPPEGD